MRRLFVITTLLISLFVSGCSKSSDLSNVDDRSELVSPTGNIASTTASGKGKPASSAIDDAPAASSAELINPLPSPTGFVNDYAKVIDGQTKKDLEARIEKLKKDSKIEFAVVTIDTTGDKPHNDYADAVARGWGIGPKVGGGGLILLIAVKDRRWVLRWSRSLMDDLVDGTEEELMRLMTEPFRQGNYSEGITKGVEAVISKLAERRGFSSD